MFEKETATDPAGPSPPPDVEIVGGNLEAAVRDLAALVSSIDPKLGAVRDSLTAVTQASHALRDVAAAWGESQRRADQELREFAEAVGETLRRLEKRLDALPPDIVDTLQRLEKRLDAVSAEIGRLSSALL